MKQLYVYLGVLLVLLSLPGGTDAAKLAPAQLVYVQSAGGSVKVSTDMGNYGEGSDLDEAFADLENTTAGKVFLDTADYLLLDEASVRMLPEMAKRLKGNCRVCLAEGVEDLFGAAIYLDSHQPGTELRDLRDESGELPHLTENDGRFCLKG